MGISGLFSFINTVAEYKNLKRTIENKRIAVDIFWFLHKHKGNIESFKQDTDLDILLSYSREVFVVYDGKPPPEKIQKLQRDKLRRREMKQSIQNIEIFLAYDTELGEGDRQYLQDYIESLYKQIWKPSYEYILQSQLYLNSRGAYIINAPFEADTEIADMFHTGMVDYVVTNDSDLIILGCTQIIRPDHKLQMRESRGGKENICRWVYNIPKMLYRLSHTPETWDTFLELCSYNHTGDIDKISSIVRVYKHKKIILRKFPQYFGKLREHVAIN
jgi:exonuclease-1